SMPGGALPSSRAPSLPHRSGTLGPRNTNPFRRQGVMTHDTSSRQSERESAGSIRSPLRLSKLSGRSQNPAPRPLQLLEAERLQSARLGLEAELDDEPRLLEV